ncbi:MAG TPA: transcription-repair coupling factor [Candidatus Deferrimicrobiaceae bacterium]|jgi:transcription-repair coupling factor (superfamily II helicase)
MFSDHPVLSFEHVAVALTDPAASPAIQLLKVPPGARAFLASALCTRLARPLLFVVPTDAEAEETCREVAAYAGADRVVSFPSAEVAPYEASPPFGPAVHDRMRTLLRLSDAEPVIVVATAATLIEKTLPPEIFQEAVLRLSPGVEVDIEALSRRLAALGYARLPAAADPGDFAVRGGIVDIYSPAHPYPARVTLDFDRVAEIRWFDPETQRTRGTGETLVVVPCSQVLLQPEYVAAALAGGGLSDTSEEALRQGIRFHGIEALLPRLYGRSSSLFEYLPPGTVTIAVDASACKAAVRAAYDEGADNFLISGQEAGLPAPDELFLPPEALSVHLKDAPLVSFDALDLAPFDRRDALRGMMEIEGNEEIRRVTVASASEGLLLPLATEGKAWWKRGARFVISSLSPSQTDRMEELLSNYALPFSTGKTLAEAMSADRGVFLCCSEVTRGFRCPELSVGVVTEAEIFGEKQRNRRARKATTAPVEEFTLRELRIDDLAVHVDHGVGVYRGMLRRAAGGVEGDYLVLEYAGGDRLFVPVGKLDRVQRYIASEESRPTLAKLGGTAWQRAKQKVRDSLLAMAQELIDLQAKREIATRPPASPPDATYREFEAAFPHEETPDQETVIREVLKDLTSARPMDRLVCGDVGYGKTEVAIRAAYKVVMDGRQVAILVPTTVLAEQHYRTFQSRLSATPVRVDILSRFRSKDEQKETVKGLADGTVDIVIGTHRLLQKDIAFKALGLVVIDEEQRFGVAHKEKMKKLRASVDILTLSATPIPRTLHMAFSGIRDISVIATPPEDRLSIRTFVLPFSEETIKGAVEREVHRGGQLYFVHNRVQSLPALARYLGEILPSVRIGVAHGQMDEVALATAMDDFASKRTDLLLCTAIIESGLDIPNANTILVNQAHRFGLSQLYQLRGRVGRDRHRAYAYFLVPKDVAMTKEAVQRLSVLEELTELGSGFKIASHDLEIRGGGNLLGKDQSGHIHQVGYELYTQLLAETVQEISGNASLAEEEPELDLRIPAFLPDDYILEAGTRLDFYRRFSKVRTVEAGDELELELLDRFGRLPDPAEALCDLSRLRVAMREGGVKELKRGEKALYLTLSARAEVDRSQLVRWVTKERGTFSFVRGEVLAMRIESDAPGVVLSSARKLLNRFAPGSNI